MTPHSAASYDVPAGPLNLTLEVERLTRELREMTEQRDDANVARNAQADAWAAMRNQRDAAWRAQAELVEARIALANSEACRAQAEQDAARMQATLDNARQAIIDQRERIAVAQDERDGYRAESNAARQDANQLYDTLLSIQSACGPFHSAALALAAHAQAVTK